MRTLTPARVLLVAAAAVLAGLAGAATTWLVTSSEVRLTVDHRSERVRTHAATVAGALHDAGVVTGPHDRIDPAPDQPLPDDRVVTVDRRRAVVVAGDDGVRLEVLHPRLAADELVRRASRPADRLLVEPAGRLGVGEVASALDPRVGEPVRLRIDGRTLLLGVGPGTRVDDLLDAIGFEPGPDDWVSPRPAEQVAAGSTVEVRRVGSALVTVTEQVPPPEERRESDALPVGSEVVLAEGRPGLVEVAREYTVVDGRVTSERVLREEVLRDPDPRVVRVGTGDQPLPASDRGPTAASAPPPPDPLLGVRDTGLPPEREAVWDRLATCESSNRWQVDTGNGFYGGLQFLPTSWELAGGTGWPHHHTREHQILMAERLLDIQGWQAWPVCSERLGLR